MQADSAPRGGAQAEADRDASTSSHSLGAWLGALLMASLVLITLANVVARYLTSQSFAWTEELSVFLMVVLALAGSAWAAWNDSHIRVDFFYLRGSPGRRQLLAVVSGLTTGMLFALLAILMVRTGLSEYAYEETTTGLGVPRWWYTAWLPLLSGAVAVAAVVRLLRPARVTPPREEAPAP